MLCEQSSVLFRLFAMMGCEGFAWTGVFFSDSISARKYALILY